MNGEKRRRKILEQLYADTAPLSGSRLAAVHGISRQVIVQDIAVLRAQNHKIISTSSGYILLKPTKPRRLFNVMHDDKSIFDELCTIVDLGGHVIDVRVEHQAYGSFAASLDVKSREDARKLTESISSGKNSPLKKLTGDRHRHLVEAETEEDLDRIEEELRTKGYLLE